jgi:hypothetical protein
MSYIVILMSFQTIYSINYDNMNNQPTVTDNHSVVLIDIQGVLKKPQNHWNNVLLIFECPSTKLNAKMRKILTRVHILNIDLLRN